MPKEDASDWQGWKPEQNTGPTIQQDNLYRKWMVHALDWTGLKEGNNSCRKDDQLSEEDLGSEGWQQAGSEESYGKLTEPAATAPLEHSPQEHQLSEEEFGELKWPQAGA